MTYKWRTGDENVVSNLRMKFGEKLKPYTDLQIAEAWELFSGSEDYSNEDEFLNWLPHSQP